MRKFRPALLDWLPRTAVGVFLLLPALSYASAAEAPDFRGVWVEIQPQKGLPIRLQVTQAGSQMQVRLSYRDTFPDAPFGNAMIENETAVWTAPQGCIGRFRWNGYDYQNPGLNTFKLSLRSPNGRTETSPLLVYVQESRWDAPCAANHPIGIERIEKLLRRQ